MLTSILKRIFKLLKRILLFLFSLIAIYFLSALILSLVKTHPPGQECFNQTEIFITSNGIHIDIVLPVEEIEPGFLETLEIRADTKYVAFGWGDKNFYINTPEWKDLTFNTAFKALFLKSETAMHVTNYSGKYESWKMIKICKIQKDILNRYISDSFQKTDNGELIKIDAPGYYGTDFFFEAKGSFSLFKTCNIWVNRALKEIGIETSVWSPFDWGILHHLPE